MPDALPALGERVFIVDMARCVGCFACSVACKDRADLPDELDWLRVERCEAGAYPRPSLAFRVVHCFHCAAPACAAACPTGAIAANDEGWVAIDQALCAACGACADACPFGAIALDASGAPSKCDGCVDELALGWQPTCVRACPMRALALAPSAELGRPRRADPTWDDAGIGPRVYYAVRDGAPPEGETHG
jgi:anaerobic dimethyl sulfoxide reductase subunit B (iron-sulfur subunit)